MPGKKTMAQLFLAINSTGFAFSTFFSKLYFIVWSFIILIIDEIKNIYFYKFRNIKKTKKLSINHVKTLTSSNYW